MEWKSIAKQIRDNDLVLHGNRIGIVRDEKKDTIKYGSLELVRHDSFTAMPLTGHIVVFGNEYDGALELGMSVSFNKYNAIQFELDLDEDSQPITIDVLHAKDIYLSWPED
jgi:hypothetical protein